MTQQQTTASSALSYIQTNFPELESTYLANVEKAKKSVLQQLMQAVVREQLVETSWGISS
ncbi:hypothetical protein [Mangrovibacillus cuniculi]|uniref:Uncharacterized protein n=1 Tax=Mangrovibacillus cuniculi TaxID=2593652 RepID=A0A7S8HEA4_9BACI|nr:hypothetical protein [Mangrovibacillus cuniculi]QPC45634.1 hypothetical protein G8O30_00925 [Mangrovibacillus cuniculi]